MSKKKKLIVFLYVMVLMTVGVWGVNASILYDQSKKDAPTVSVDDALAELESTEDTKSFDYEYKTVQIGELTDQWKFYYKNEKGEIVELTSFQPGQNMQPIVYNDTVYVRSGFLLEHLGFGGTFDKESKTMTFYHPKYKDEGKSGVSQPEKETKTVAENTEKETKDTTTQKQESTQKKTQSTNGSKSSTSNKETSKQQEKKVETSSKKSVATKEETKQKSSSSTSNKTNDDNTPTKAPDNTKYVQQVNEYIQLSKSKSKGSIASNKVLSDNELLSMVEHMNEANRILSNLASPLYDITENYDSAYLVADDMKSVHGHISFLRSYTATDNDVKSFVSKYDNAAPLIPKIMQSKSKSTLQQYESIMDTTSQHIINLGKRVGL